MIKIIGAGALGGPIAIHLLRLGLPFEIYDFDVVEDKNLNNQVYEQAHIGLTKVEALEEICTRIDPILAKMCKFVNQKITKREIKDWDDTVFMAVDKISLRKEFATNLTRAKFVIDGRLGAKSGRILGFKRYQFRDYLDTCFDEENIASESECSTVKDLAFVAAQLASYAMVMFKLAFTPGEVNDIIYSVYNLEIDSFKWD